MTSETLHSLFMPRLLPLLVLVTVMQGGSSESSIAADGDAFLLFLVEGRDEGCDNEKIRVDSGSPLYHVLLSN